MDPVAVRVERRPVARGQQPVGQRVPARVERRDDERVGVVGRGRLVVVGQVDQAGQRALERVRVGLVPVVAALALGLRLRGQRLVGHPQRAAQRQHAGRVVVGDRRQVRAGLEHVDVAGPDAGVDGLGPQLAHEVLEVAHLAGAEEPAEVVGHGRALLAARVVLPRRVSRARRRRRVETEPGQPAALERRHDERVVGRVGGELARADQTRVGEVGVLAERRGEPGQHRAHVVGHQRPGRTSERLTWTCAHAHSSAATGSAVASLIVIEASGRSGAETSSNSSSLSTTRVIHGRSRLVRRSAQPGV